MILTLFFINILFGYYYYRFIIVLVYFYIISYGNV